MPNGPSRPCAAPWPTMKSRSRPRAQVRTPGRFTGKVVLVTGAAQSIGEHTARRISAEGGVLVLARPLPTWWNFHETNSPRAASRTHVAANLEHYDGAKKTSSARRFRVRPHRRTDQQRGRRDQFQAVLGSPKPRSRAELDLALC